MIDIKNVTVILDFIIDTFKYPNEIESIVDMTLGNGYDSLKLLKHFNSAFLYGFDIQKSAINNSTILLDKNNLNGRYLFFNKSHERASEYINKKIDIIIYNLGYLPGGDKKIKTTYKTTVLSLMDCIKNLSKIGTFVFITLYLGHEGGKEEYNSVIEYLKTLDQKKFNIFEISFINQINNPPKLIVIERKKWKD